MDFNRKKLIPILLLAFTFLITFKYIFDPKLDFGGDNASYFTLGKAIAEGKGYVNLEKIDQNAHGHFPPGYPLVVSLVHLVWPADDAVNGVKYFNGLLFLASAIFLFFVSEKLVKNAYLSFGIAFLYILNANFLKFSTIMMSEILFQAINHACLLLLLNLDFKKPVFKNTLFILLLVLTTFNFHTRSVGLAVAGGIGIYLLLIKKWPYMIAWGVGFVLLCLPWQIRNYQQGIRSNNYAKQFLQKNPYRIEQGRLDFSSWTERVAKNTKRYVAKEIPLGMFPFKSANYKEEITAWELLIGIGMLTVIGLGIYYLKEYWKFTIPYIICNLLILLNWPDIWTGPRFVFQLLPLFLIFFFFGIYKVAGQKIKKAAFNPQKKQYLALSIVILAYFLRSKVIALHKNTKSVYNGNFAQYIELAEWSKKNLPKESVIACRKPLFFHMYSETFTGYYPRVPDREKVVRNMKEEQVTHVVVDKLGYSSTNRYLVPAVQKYPYKFKTVVKIGDTHLLQFRPNLGYEGSFNDNEKREGFGKFVWENGQIFEGTWANNVRNGEGTLLLPNGNTIAGIWANDKLEGPAQLIDPNGIARQNLIYKENQLISANPI